MIVAMLPRYAVGAYNDEATQVFLNRCPQTSVVRSVKIGGEIMSVITFEAIVENGQIKLLNAFRLPEKTRVYVVVPSVEAQPTFFIGSPRLAHPEQAADFVKEIIEEP